VLAQATQQVLFVATKTVSFRSFSAFPMIFSLRPLS
jgi:hypothetical protein